MPGENARPMQVVIHQDPPKNGGFQQQAFGPWTTGDIQVTRTNTKTNAQSGVVQKKFQATYPPAPTISEPKTAITGGYEFSINVVNSKRVAGYNIYGSVTNNAAVSTLIQYQAQPPNTTQVQTLKIQDTTAANPYYWIAAVNQVGVESARIPAAGNPAPKPTQAAAPGGASGTGAGGGAAGRKGGPIYT